MRLVECRKPPNVGERIRFRTLGVECELLAEGPALAVTPSGLVGVPIVRVAVEKGSYRAPHGGRQTVVDLVWTHGCFTLRWVGERDAGG